MISRSNTRPSLLYNFMWALIPIALIYCIGMTIFTLMHVPIQLPDSENSPQLMFFQTLVVAPCIIILGFTVTRRASGNICGVLLILWGCSVVGSAAFDSGSPLAESIVQTFNQSLSFVSLFLLILYFPTGLPLIHWANRFALLFTLFCVIYAPLNVLSAPLTDSGAPNPVFVPALGVLNLILPSLFPLILFPVAITSIFLLIMRFRRARGIERQQMRWMMYTSLTYLGLIIAWLFVVLIPDAWNGLYGQVVRLVSATWFYMGIPLAIGGAILRYRLYDIDIIIRRTLIYTVLTGILAVIYFGGVILTQQVFKAATGQTSDLAIVVSTLLIAALFARVRRRVQDTIDRRLYRRKYDAEQTLAHFSETLRDEVDLEKLKASLIGVVQDTMQPTRIALWVKEYDQ